jgi:hypothetical protein
VPGHSRLLLPQHNCAVGVGAGEEGGVHVPRGCSDAP